MQHAPVSIVPTAEDAKALFTLEALHVFEHAYTGLIHDPAHSAFYAGFYRRGEYAGSSVILPQPALDGLVKAFTDKAGAWQLAYRDNEMMKNGTTHFGAGAGGQSIFVVANPEESHVAGARIQIEKVLPQLREGLKTINRLAKAPQSTIARQGRALVHVWSEQMHLAYKNTINADYVLPFETTPVARRTNAYAGW